MAHDGRLSFVFIKNIKRWHTTRLKIIMSIRFFNVQKDTVFNEKYVTLSEKHMDIFKHTIRSLVIEKMIVDK